MLLYKFFLPRDVMHSACDVRS